jgi:hypothetical protein
MRTAELQKTILFVQMKRPKNLVKTKVEYIREPSVPHLNRTISILNVEPDNHQFVQIYKKQFAECLVKEIKDKLNYKVRKAMILDFFPGPEGPSYQDLR